MLSYWLLVLCLRLMEMKWFLWDVIKSWNFSVHFCLCAAGPLIWGVIRPPSEKMWFWLVIWGHAMMYNTQRLWMWSCMRSQTPYRSSSIPANGVLFSVTATSALFLRLCSAPSELVCLSSSSLSNMELKFHIRIWKLEKRICLSLHAYLERNQLQIFKSQVYLKLWVMETQA